MLDAGASVIGDTASTVSQRRTDAFESFAAVHLFNRVNMPIFMTVVMSAVQRLRTLCSHC